MTSTEQQSPAQKSFNPGGSENLIIIRELFSSPLRSERSLANALEARLLRALELSAVMKSATKSVSVRRVEVNPEGRGPEIEISPSGSVSIKQTVSVTLARPLVKNREETEFNTIFISALHEGVTGAGKLLSNLAPKGTSDIKQLIQSGEPPLEVLGHFWLERLDKGLDRTTVEDSSLFLIYRKSQSLARSVAAALLRGEAETMKIIVNRLVEKIEGRAADW